MTVYDILQPIQACIALYTHVLCRQRSSLCLHCLSFTLFSQASSLSSAIASYNPLSQQTVPAGSCHTETTLVLPPSVTCL